MELIGPDAEEHCTLEDELVAVRRTAEPVEESLDDVAGQDELKVLALLAGQVRQPVAHRRGQVAGPVLAHVRDSR
jgi:hypothetical protein